MPPEPPLISLPAAARKWPGFGRSWWYEHRDELAGVVRIGGRYWLRVRVFEAWLNGKDDAPPSDLPMPIRRTG